MDNIEMDEAEIGGIKFVDDGRLQNLRDDAASDDPLHGLGD